jgi:tetratricopeptide (TPR) repeat protein
VDIYALGAILYELLTGRPPFRAATILETLDQVCSRDPVPPVQLQPTVPRDLETICLKCLSKEPARRYGSALELAGDLRRFLNHEPIKARRAGSAERLAKWARRKPSQAALVAVSALLLGLFVFALVREAWDYRRKYEQQLQAEKALQEDEQTYLTARELAADGELGKARDLLGKVLGRLAGRADPRAEELKERARKKLDEVVAQSQDRDNRQQARERERTIWRPQAQAVFHWAPLFGARLAESRDQARDHAREALAVYGLAGEADQAEQLTAVLRRDRPYLSPAEFAGLTESCYNLLLIWADVEAGGSTLAADRSQEARVRAERALAVLDRAAILGQAFGVDTQALHRHQARYQALGRGEPFDPTRVEPAGPPQPTGALDWFLKGLDCYERGQVNEAADACEQALRLRGDHYWAHYLKGLCDLRAGRWPDARTQLSFCVEQRAEFAWPLIYRGFAAGELGARYAQYEAQASRAHGPDAEITRQYRHDKESQFHSARTDLDTALGQALDASMRYTALTNRGVLCIRQERWAEASADLKQAVAVLPAAPQAYANLAQALQGAGRGNEALAAMNQAIERLPEGPAFVNLRVDLYGARAKLHLLHKDRKSAGEDFERAIAHEPKESQSRRLAENLVESGQLLAREGKHPEALARFDRALQVRPELVLAQRYRAESLLELNRAAEASQALDDYLARTKEPEPKVLQARGHLYAQTGRVSAAIEAYSTALRLFDPRDLPNITQTRGYRGWTYLECGAAQLALEDFEACLRQQPASADFLTGRASARVRLRQWRQALDDAAGAEKQGRLSPQLLYYLSCVYAQAAGQAALEARTGRDSLAVRSQAVYEDSALKYLQRALGEMPEERRGKFWRDQVQSDPGLAAVRRTPLYLQMERQYGARDR